MLFMGVTIVFPMIFIVFFSSGDVGETDNIVNFTDNKLITKTLESQKQYKGNWVDYLTGVFALSGFNEEHIKEVEIDKMADNMESQGRELVFGDNYEIYKEARAYFELIYKGLADTQEKIYKYVDEQGNVYFEVENITVYNAFYPIPEGYSYTNHSGDDNEMERENQFKISTKKGTPIIASTGGTIVDSYEGENGWIICILDSNKRYWQYEGLGNSEHIVDRVHTGTNVETGQLIGQAGNDDLIIKIGVNFSTDFNTDENEITWINPYGILKFIENNKLVNYIFTKEAYNEFY